MLERQTGGDQPDVGLRESPLLFRKLADDGPFEILMQPHGEYVVAQRVDQQRERQLRRARAAIGPFEAGRA